MSDREQNDGERSGGTGPGGSPAERETAGRLARELEATGREVESREYRVPAGAANVTTLHAALGMAAGLLGLVSPLAGAAVALVVAFSFYGERGLGLPLLGRLLPRRRTLNVISPPLGPDWEQVEVMVAAGYDTVAPDPMAELLARVSGGRLTPERTVLWLGLIPLFAILMLKVTGAEGFLVNLIQFVTIVIMLAAVFAGVDRALPGRAQGTEGDLEAARNLIAVIDRLESDPEPGDPAVAILLAGAETDGAAGANALYTDPGFEVDPGVAVIGLITAAEGSPPQATGREGDLTSVRTDYSLIADTDALPRQVILRRDTAAGRARRRGVRATTLIERGERARDLALDTVTTLDRKVKG